MSEKEYRPEQPQGNETDLDRIVKVYIDELEEDEINGTETFDKTTRQTIRTYALYELSKFANNNRSFKPVEDGNIVWSI